VNRQNSPELTFINVPARDPSSLVPFYNRLLGAEFVQNDQSPMPQWYAPVTADGVDLTITQRSDARDVTAVYWGVSDINAAIEALQGQGGELISPPAPTPDGGQAALMLDPEGNPIGLLELTEQSAKYFRAGEYGAEFQEALERRREEAQAGAKGS
jgi:predicted enzyme related to lactoylglutathione lyase